MAHIGVKVIEKAMANALERQKQSALFRSASAVAAKLNQQQDELPDERINRLKHRAAAYGQKQFRMVQGQRDYLYK